MDHNYATLCGCLNSTNYQDFLFDSHCHTVNFFCAEAIPTADEKVAFTDIDAAMLVGAFPRKAGMERKDLLERNAKIFESQGKSLDQYAKKSVKVTETFGH